MIRIASAITITAMSGCVLLILGGGMVHAQGSAATTADCAMVAARTVLGIPASDIFPQDAIDRATKNLRSYCCEQNILRDSASVQICDDSDMPPDKYFPQSAYLFDHIVDIMLRRLDGNQDLIYPDVALDEDGAQWRSDIRIYANTPEGVNPAAIVNLANTYRWPNRATPSLLDKYNSICARAFAIYEPLGKVWQSPGGASTARIAQVGGPCFIMVQERIDDEYLYIRNTINRMANLYLGNYRNNNNSYTSTRLANLQSTVSEIVSAFTTVNRLVVEGTRQCSM